MRFRPLRAKRRRRLLESHLLPFEAMALSTVALRQPYNRALRRDRRKMYRQWARKAQLAGWSQRRLESEFEAQIRLDYEANKWLVKPTATVRRRLVGQADPWAMLREYRQRAMDAGEYAPPRRKRRKFDEHGRRIDKGNIIAQKARYRERQSIVKQGGGFHRRYTMDDLRNYESGHGR